MLIAHACNADVLLEFTGRVIINVIGYNGSYFDKSIVGVI